VGHCGFMRAFVFYGFAEFVGVSQVLQSFCSFVGSVGFLWGFVGLCRIM